MSGRIVFSGICLFVVIIVTLLDFQLSQAKESNSEIIYIGSTNRSHYIHQMKRVSSINSS